MKRTASQVPAADQAGQVGQADRPGGFEGDPQGEAPAEAHPVEEGSGVGHRLDPVGQLGDGEEGPREQKEGDDPEAEQVGEADLVLEAGGVGGDRRGERQPDQDRRGHRQGRLERGGGPEGGHDRRVHHRDEGDPDRHPAEVPQHQVVHLDGGGQGGVVGLAPLDAGHHRERGVPGGRLHRGGREQARGEERQVGDGQVARAGALVHQLPQAHPHRQQVEGRVQEARDDTAPPRAAVHAGPGFHEHAGRDGQPSLDQAPTGQAEEHVLQGGAAAHHRLGDHPP